MSSTPFAVFILATVDDNRFAATTRPGGGIGLPGGKVEAGETPVAAAIREAREEGWQIDLPPDAQPVYVAAVEGRTVWWFASRSLPVRLTDWADMGRITPVVATTWEIEATGMGNREAVWAVGRMLLDEHDERTLENMFGGKLAASRGRFAQCMGEIMHGQSE